MDDKRLIETTNKIQEALALLGAEDGGQAQLDLPRIAVVGGQSAGKSSVLESIVGFDFLPRGVGIVTRRPLIIELITTKQGAAVRSTLKDTFSGKERDFTNMRAVVDAISAATESHPSCQNNCVCDDPVILEIRSPDVLTLTLIDLPGMTRLSMAGQPDDISEQIEEMVRNYIDNKSTIILAVTPANADLATSDAIKIAREVDPLGTRTVGVLTKVDIIDRGTEHLARAIIENDDEHVPFAWVPVKNRSQADINDSKTVATQRREEKEFFDKLFMDLKWEDPPGAGIKYLSKHLHSTLVDEIKKNLHSIEKNAKRVLESKRKELEEMKMESDVLSWKKMAGKSINAYKTHLVKELAGRDNNSALGRVCAGARIVDIYKGDFAETMKSLDPLKDLDDTTLLAVIKNARGHDDSAFLPQEAFKTVVRKNVDDLVPLCHSCVDEVCEELKKLAQVVPIRSTSALLKNWISETTVENIDQWKDECKAFITKLVRMERRVNLDHPDYYSQTELAEKLAELERENRKSVRKKLSPKVEASGVELFKLKVGREFANSPIQEYILLADGRLMNNKYEDDFVELRNSQLTFCEENERSITDQNWGMSWSLLVEVEDVDLGRKTRIWCLAASKATIRRRLKDFVASPPDDKSQHVKRVQKTVSDAGEIAMLKDLLKKYFDIVRIKVIDSVPKAIALHLVDSVEEKLGDVLSDDFFHLDDSGELMNLMGVTKEDEKRRKDVEKVVTKLDEALMAMNSFKGLRRMDPEYT